MKTQKQIERHLDAILFDSLSEQQAVDEFIYLTNKSRGKHTTEANIRKQHQNRNLVALIKRLDPIRYNLAVQECSY